MSMKIEKIVSGGQTGADRAALDFARAHRIPYGGWVPKGRLAEDGPLPPDAALLEMPTASYRRRTEQNVIDSDGTLIVSHGPLAGGSAYTRKMAMAHRKPWFHVDLSRTPALQAAMVVGDWLAAKGIRILNVAGPRASEDPQIYGAVTHLLEILWGLPAKRRPPGKPVSAPPVPLPPATVAEAVDFLAARLSLRDKTRLARMAAGDLSELQLSYGIYIRNLLFYPRNRALLESCREAAGDKYLHWDQAPAVIIRALWRRLRRTHRLRVVAQGDPPPEDVPGPG